MKQNGTKKMVYLSVKNPEKDPVLCFETEDYYKNKNRLVYTSVDFESFELEKALSQENLLELGFMLAVGFVPYPKYRSGEEIRFAIVVYTNSDEKNPRIFIDEEPYIPNPLRKFETSTPLHDTVVSKMSRNEPFYTAMAETVLRLLLPDVPFDSEYLRKRTREN